MLAVGYAPSLKCRTGYHLEKKDTHKMVWMPYRAFPVPKLTAGGRWKIDLVYKMPAYVG
jgi:hypothetical protein